MIDKEKYRSMLKERNMILDSEDFESLWNTLQKVINDRTRRGLTTTERYAVNSNISLLKILGVKL